MAYFSGQVSSYDELKAVLISNSQTQGWEWNNITNELTKGALQVKVTTVSVGGNNLGPGLTCQGIKNSIASATMRIGPATSIASAFISPTFPLKYHLFIFNDPDEVYLIINYSIDRFQFMSFGESTLVPNGMWLTASLGGRYVSSAAGVYISPTTGGQSGGIGNVSTSGPFWQTYTMSAANSVIATQDFFLNGLDAINWSSVNALTENVQVVRAVQPLISRTPSNVFSTDILLPFKITLPRASNKFSIVSEFKNSRLLRMDNLEQEQILQFGNDRWMVLPFHRKNAAVRDGGSFIDHTGTLGWAIRYDGP